jgi:uncharacterized membrane-anchored protein
MPSSCCKEMSVGEDTTEFVVGELGKHRQDDDVIMAVARRANLSWEQAERLVQEIKIEHRRRIVRRRSPLLIAVGVGTAIGGFVLIALAVEGWNLEYLLLGAAMVVGSAWGLGSVILNLMER